MSDLYLLVQVLYCVVVNHHYSPRVLIHNHLCGETVREGVVCILLRLFLQLLNDLLQLMSLHRQIEDRLVCLNVFFLQERHGFVLGLVFGVVFVWRSHHALTLDDVRH